MQSLPALAIEVHRAGLIPHRNLFADGLSTSVPLLKDSNIYLLAKVPKVRLKSKLAYDSANTQLSATLLVGETVPVETRLPLNQLAYFRDLSSTFLSKLPLISRP